MPHAQLEPGTGGTPPGVRLSFAAITVLLTLVAFTAGALAFVRASDLEAVDLRVSQVEASRKESLEAIDARLKRIEYQLDAIRADMIRNQSPHE